MIDIIQQKQLEECVDSKDLVTPKWVLMQLSNNLEHHMTFTCKNKKTVH